MTVAIPEPGQLVEVRRRQWVVIDIESSGFARTNGSDNQHLVALTSLDEDAFNESLVAVWELEPGARILETAGLPDIEGWDSCERLEAFLDAIRWGAATDADRSLLQAPFRSGVEIQGTRLPRFCGNYGKRASNASDVKLGRTAGLCGKGLRSDYVCVGGGQIRGYRSLNREIEYG